MGSAKDTLKDAQESYERLRNDVKSIGYGAMTGDIELHDPQQVIDSVDALLNGPLSGVLDGLEDIHHACYSKRDN